MCRIIKPTTNQRPKKTLKDSLTKFLNHMEVVHHQVLKVGYLLESIHVEYSNSDHA